MFLSLRMSSLWQVQFPLAETCSKLAVSLKLSFTLHLEICPTRYNKASLLPTYLHVKQFFQIFNSAESSKYACSTLSFFRGKNMFILKVNILFISFTSLIFFFFNSLKNTNKKECKDRSIRSVPILEECFKGQFALDPCFFITLHLTLLLSLAVCG